MNLFATKARDRSAGAKRKATRKNRELGQSKLSLELLETRSLLSASTEVASPALVVTPLATSNTPYGYSPTQIRTAYGFAGLTFSNGKAADGSGETIAIVDAYNDPDIASDLAKFDSQYGLAAANLTVVSQTGGSAASLATNAGWALETSLDVEWAHAIAPGAKILLVEANSDNLSDLLAAVNYAKNVSGVVSVSMSWGSSEFSGETAYDSTFIKSGVTFVASSGDSGSPPGWPGVSPNVLSVGGTTLNLNSSGAYSSETAWSGSTGGLSSFESEPAYQSENIKTAFGSRANPDVAYDANPNTGVSVYDSVTYDGQSGWWEVGGTSEGAPQWAALIAIADQGRGYAGLGPLSSQGSLTEAQGGTQASIYNLSAADFHDITSGGNGGFSAGTGYDGVTGLGSPLAGLVIEDLATGTNGTGSPVSMSSGLTSSGGTTGGGAGTTGRGGSGGGGGHRHGSGRFAEGVGPGSGFSITTTAGLGADSLQTGSFNSTLATMPAPAVAIGVAASQAAWNSQPVVMVRLSGGLVATDADESLGVVRSTDAAGQSSAQSSGGQDAFQSRASSANSTDGVGDWSAPDATAFRQTALQTIGRMQLAPGALDVILNAEENSIEIAMAKSVRSEAAATRQPMPANRLVESSPTVISLAALAVVLQPRVNWRAEVRFDALRFKQPIYGSLQ